MTIKMLIVDDEPIICQGLHTTIDWEELGIVVTGIAYDGAQAIELIKQEPVDLILTDVCMPEMDGLALTEYVISEYPHTKIIMISGYDEFKYARQALRLGVEDYLLKPVDIDELLTLIKKINGDILQQRNEKVQHEKVIISQWALHYLFNSPLSLEVKSTKVDYINNYRIFISEIADYHQLIMNLTSDEIATLKTKWKGHVDKVLSEHDTEHISIFGHENELFTICYHKDTTCLDDQSIKDICYKIDKLWDYSMRFGISAQHYELSEITSLYKEVSALLSDFHGKKDAPLVAKELSLNNNLVVYPQQWEGRLREAILNQNDKEVKQLVKSMFESLQEEDTSLERALHMCQEMIGITKKRLQEVVNSKRLEQLKLMLLNRVDLKIYNTYTSLQRMYLEDMNLMGEVIKARTNKNHWIIENAKKYIQENYKKDIKASEIAEDQFITPNYFSVIFKQETGVSFSEYLNSLRIAKGSELLLNTANKVFEIAEYVGYKEYKYFVQVFKKYKGVTPTHYRKLNTPKVK